MSESEESDEEMFEEVKPEDNLRKQLAIYMEMFDDSPLTEKPTLEELLQKTKEDSSDYSDSDSGPDLPSDGEGLRMPIGPPPPLRRQNA